MKKFERVTSRAVCFPAENINTDQIIPARFLKRIDRTGWGDQLFIDLKPPEVFGLPDARERRILIAGLNFGSGSSREHAVWAIRDFGFQVLIAPAFADIFKENSLKNGLLTIELASAEYAGILAAWQKSPDATMTVDLERQRIEFAGRETPFTVNSFSRTCLLEGLDELGYILRHEPQIAAFEKRVGDGGRGRIGDYGTI
jgi:3-isopropylmalate/(R)-2-methylmalate dehydratase small subunit